MVNYSTNINKKNNDIQPQTTKHKSSRKMALKRQVPDLSHIIADIKCLQNIYLHLNLNLGLFSCSLQEFCEKKTHTQS